MPMMREALEGFGPDPQPDVVLAMWAEDPGWRHAHPEIEWDTTGIGIGNAARGPVGVANLWADWIEGMTRYVYWMREYRDIGDWILAVADIQATARGGLPIEMRSFQLWRVKDGKVIACRTFLSEADALNAAGPAA